MAHVLAESNQTLVQQLRIHSYRNVTALEEEMFAQMLEMNQTLQYLYLSRYEGDLRPKIEYYLSWNRRGRYLLNSLLRKSCQFAANRKSRQLTKKEHKYQQSKKKSRARKALMRP